MHAADPQTQPAGSRFMLSADNYHWVKKRGDTTGRSLIYSLTATLLLLGITSPSRWSRQVLFTSPPQNDPRLQHGSCTDGDKQQHGRDAA